MKLLQDSYAGIVSLKWYEAILCMVIAIVLYVSSTCLFALGGVPLWPSRIKVKGSSW
jgi:hypothetical protein